MDSPVDCGSGSGGGGWVNFRVSFKVSSYFFFAAAPVVTTFSHQRERHTLKNTKKKKFTEQTHKLQDISSAAPRELSTHLSRLMVKMSIGAKVKRARVTIK